MNATEPPKPEASEAPEGPGAPAGPGAPEAPGPVVTVSVESPQPIAVRTATTSIAEFGALWPRLLDDVWAWLRANDVTSGCPNVMVYRERPGSGPDADAGSGPDADTGSVSGSGSGQLDVEVGVRLPTPLEPTGAIVLSSLPGGRVATAVHRGPYDRLGDAYRALDDWCAAHGEQPAGVRWEIYGPHRDEPAELTTTVCFLLT